MTQQNFNSLEMNTRVGVLGPDELAFWQENGYIVIKQAFSAEHCERVKQAIWEFIKASPDEPDSWYKPYPTLASDFRLSFFEHPALSATRTSAKIRTIYEQLYGTIPIVPNLQTVGFTPPESSSYTFNGMGLHWDVSLHHPIPFSLQGLLYLTDVDRNGGCFHCVPGFHRTINDWLGSLPAGAEPRKLAMELLEAIPVEGNAGDFIIWHQALPHCATPNKSREPRMVQYFSYVPASAASAGPWI